MKKTKFELLISDGKVTFYDSGGDKFDHDYEEDPVLISRAINYFQSNIFSFFACMLSGLLGLMFLPGIVRVLSTTQKSNNPLRAFLRYLSTVNHTLSWYSTPGEKRRASLKTVRRLHAAANKLSVSTHGEAAFMTQFDMVTTQWAFVGPVFVIPEKLGFSTPSDEDLNAVRHLMYCVGKVLGVDDKYNLCSGDLDECKQYCKDILVNVISPAMVDVDKSEEGLATHLLEGMHLFNPAIDPEAYLHWTRRLYGSIRKNEVPQFTKIFSKIMYFFHCYFFEYIMHIWIMRPILILPTMNGLMRLNIYLANYLKDDIVKTNSKFFSL